MTTIACPRARAEGGGGGWIYTREQRGRKANVKCVLPFLILKIQVSLPQLLRCVGLSPATIWEDELCVVFLVSEMDLVRAPSFPHNYD